MHPSQLPCRNNGFSLVELAIVLVIVALLTSGLLLGIAAQRNAAENVDAQRQLENIREALLGFAMANGRLPCPAKANLPNTDDDAGKALTPPCDGLLQHGVLPWKTLGLPETDPWGNRFTYTASSTFTKSKLPEALASFTLTDIGNADVKESTAGSTIAADLPAVIVSHGSRAAGAWQTGGNQLPGATGDELENSNATMTFISHTPTDTFDDLVVWIPPSILKAKMVAAGRLP
ncbi:MAG: type II secretion system protein [Candidatus Dechloromonas phosphoritropha]|nr:type II secretion system protein [Azonexus sp.]MBP9228942.1 type II secretion system protein [Azonexus sp.]